MSLVTRVYINPLTSGSICNSLYRQPYNYYTIISENLVLEQLIIPKLIYLFILITYLVDIVLILTGEILSWSLMGVEGLIILTKLATVKTRKLVGISRGKRGEGGGVIGDRLVLHPGAPRNILWRRGNEFDFTLHLPRCV